MSIRTLSAALLAALLLFCPGCAPGPLEEQFFAMDTLVSLQIPGDEEGGEEAAVEVRRLLAELERLWSPALPESEVAALNRGETVTPDPRTAALLQQAAALSARTGGSFHPMMGALVQLWNVGSATRPPASGAVEALLPPADPACLALSEDGSLTLPEGAGLDLGGIAKGAAGALAEALLEEHGIGSALLTLGGQVICCGTPDDDWRIALRNPDDAAHPLGVLSIAAGSVATSGDYERYFELGGRRYHHILDPVTGWPASVDLRSVTVVSDSAVTADALSTALFIMGHEGAIAHWRQQTDFEMILVGTDGLLTVTAGLEDRFEAVDGAEVLVVRR